MLWLSIPVQNFVVNKATNNEDNEGADAAPLPKPKDVKKPSPIRVKPHPANIISAQKWV